MPNFFNTVTVQMSNSQKKNLYKEYEFGISRGFIEGPKLSFDDYFNQPDIFKMIDMKCLDCHQQLRISYEKYSFDVEVCEAAFPLDYCPECGKLQFVPLDIYIIKFL